MHRTQNLHVRKMVRLVTPNELKAELPVTEAANRTVVESRERVTRILRQEAAAPPWAAESPKGRGSRMGRVTELIGVRNVSRSRTL